MSGSDFSFPRFLRPRGARRKSARERSLSKSSSAVPGVFPQARHGYFSAKDGTRIFYSIEGQGPPLVFCYGLVCSSLHWTYQIDFFRKNYQTIWFDYRGHQNSDMPKDMSTLSLETIAEDMHTLFEELQLKDAVVLGHSMGVNIVLEFYRRYPERVRAMVLANGTSKQPFETLMGTNAMQSAMDLVVSLSQMAPGLARWIWKKNARNPLVFASFATSGFNPHLTPREDIEKYIEILFETDISVFTHLVQNYGSADSTAWLHTIQVPTLILSGEEDRVIPSPQQELMHQLIPGSELVRIRHGSHCSQMDLPDLVNARIQEFLTRKVDAPVMPGETPVDPFRSARNSQSEE